ncbi:MAG: hypothetical protein J3Q66DRAFT_332905 [Benniella sp.]|nr:MAG: hypothetical protein J3Q66DRAFT_332905 [Benniella sp.]
MTSLWQQYKALPPRTRIYLGLGVMTFSMAGLYISDKLEEKLDPTRRTPEATPPAANASVEPRS